MEIVLLISCNMSRVIMMFVLRIVFVAVYDLIRLKPNIKKYSDGNCGGMDSFVSRFYYPELPNILQNESLMFGKI